MFKYLLLVALGGASGAVARYLVATGVHAWWKWSFPVGTLMVNLVGSALIGLVFVLIERQVIHPDWRGVLMVGFLGAFTTFSTFSLEVIHLLEQGRSLVALGYVLASVCCCVVATGMTVLLVRAVVN